MFENLALSAALVMATVLVHFFGILSLLYILRRHGRNFPIQESVLHQGLAILFVLLSLFIIHGLEIWFYALVYFALGALKDFDTALYFSTSTFSSLGYGDVVLLPKWRMLGAIEAPNGLILIAWSTAFLISLMNRMRIMEHDWLERPKSKNEKA